MLCHFVCFLVFLFIIWKFVKFSGSFCFAPIFSLALSLSQPQCMCLCVWHYGFSSLPASQSFTCSIWNCCFNIVFASRAHTHSVAHCVCSCLHSSHHSHFILLAIAIHLKRNVLKSILHSKLKAIFRCNWNEMREYIKWKTEEKNERQRAGICIYVYIFKPKPIVSN